MSSNDLPDVHKAYGHIAGKGVKVERRNTEVILKYCRQFFGKTEVELSVTNLAHASRLLTLPFLLHSQAQAKDQASLFDLLTAVD